MTRGDPALLKRAVLALGLLLKAVVLFHYGPFRAPDTDGYVFVADAMVSDPAFFHTVPEWATAALPPLAFRPIGYPLAIAAVRAVAGSGYETVLVGLQILLSVAVAGLLFDLVMTLTRSRPWSAAATGLYFISQSLLWDNEILSDGLYAASFSFTALILVRRFLERRPPGALLLIGLGTFWGYGILVRDSGLYFTIIPAVFLILPGWGGTAGFLRRLIPAGIFLVPVLTIVIACVSWNDYRAGVPFISVTSVANWLRPVFDIARMGRVDPFAGNSALDHVVKSSMTSYDYTEQPALLQRVHDELGLKSPFELQRLLLTKLTSTVARHPFAYASVVAQNLNPGSFGAILFDPLFNYNDFYQLGVPPYERVIPGSGLKSVRALLRAHDAVGLGLALLSAFLGALSTLAWIATTIGIPYLVIRALRKRQGVERGLQGAAVLLATFYAVAGAYALLHSEARHMLPVIPAGLASSAYLASRWSAGTRQGAPVTRPGSTTARRRCAGPSHAGC